MISMGPNGKLAIPAAPVTAVRVIGVGGAGLSVVARVSGSAGSVIECVAMHTDAQALLSSPALRKVQLGRDAANGLGAGGDPAVGHAAARESMAEIAEACAEAPLVILCAGLGGGTGSGAAPFVAQEAKKAGALTVAICTLPFSFEGHERMENAVRGLDELEQFVDTLIVVPNDRVA